jgi:hypothetical protein
MSSPNQIKKKYLAPEVVSYFDNQIDGVESQLAQEVLDRQSGDASTLSSAQTYTDQKITDLVGGAPELLDTLNELSQALGNDPNLATTISGQISGVQANLTQEIIDRQLGDTANLTRIEALENLSVAQTIYVSKNGNDTTGTGGQHKPFLTLTKAFSMITDATPSKRYVVRVAAGAYTETAVALPANVFVIGEQKEAVRITGAVSMGTWAQDNASSDDRSGFSMVTLLSAANFNFSTAKSRAGKLYMNEVVFASTLNLYGYDNAIAQAQFDSCVIFGAMTVSGINVGVFNNNICYNNVTLNQHPNGGMASILVATGGACSGTIRFNTTANDFNRRSAGFLRNFWSDNLIVDGPSSYVDADLDSQGKNSTQKLNGGQLIALTPRINHDIQTQMIQPLNTNSHNMGDWGKQWMFHFAYIHASTGTDLYLSSVDNSYDAAGSSAGYSIHIESDGYGLKPNVNGGDINLKTGAVSGTGVRGKIKLDAREVDASSLKVKNLGDGVDSGDAVNKGQLDASLTSAQSYADAAVLVEKNRAEGVESGLQSQINTEKGRIDAILSASEADKDSFAEIVNLINSVDLTNDNALASAILAEQTARENADSALDGRLTTAEGEIDTLQSGLAQELIDRAAGDSALNTRVTALETAPPGMVAHKMGPITVSSLELVSIDCEHEAKPMSLHVFVGRLAVHEGEDYTVSVVSGKTRITWIGSLVNPGGVESIEVGDKVYISYMR